MKKLFPKVLFTAIIACMISMQATSQTSADTTLIKSACLDYLEGWYTGNAERMEKALHPNLVKRRIATLQQTGGQLINQVSASDMVEYTKAGFGKAQAEEGQTSDIEIHHIYKGIATATATSKDYVDYIHIAKIGDDWKIINVLWESRK